VTVATTIPDAEIPDRHRVATGFYALVTIGCVLALVFGFHTVLHRPDLVVSTPHGHRVGLIDTTTVVVRNRSSRWSYCPDVRISALDTSGTELEAETATPLEGNGRIGPNGSVSFTATFRQLTSIDYRDKVDKWEGFVLRAPRCG
jgi:hypothetical protein